MKKYLMLIICLSALTYSQAIFAQTIESVTSAECDSVAAFQEGGIGTSLLKSVKEGITKTAIQLLAPEDVDNVSEVTVDVSMSPFPIIGRAKHGQIKAIVQMNNGTQLKLSRSGQKYINMFIGAESHKSFNKTGEYTGRVCSIFIVTDIGSERFLANLDNVSTRQTVGSGTMTVSYRKNFIIQD